MRNLVLSGSVINPYQSVPKNEVNLQSPELARKQTTLKRCLHVANNGTMESHLNFLSRSGRLEDAVAVLDSIARTESKLSPKTFINLLQSCIKSNSIALGRRIHARIDLVEERTIPLETKLVSMYAKCGALNEARKLFYEMDERNLYSWSAIIGGLSREQKWTEVIDMFYLMILDNILPDAFLSPKILRACGCVKDLRTGKIIHSIVLKCGYGAFPYVDNAILSVYAKCGEFEMAWKVFQSMGQRDIVSWNGMISGYCKSGDVDQALKLIAEMYEQGFEPSSMTWNMLIAGLFQKGHCDSALQMLKTMETFGVQPDVVSWTSMLSGLVRNNKCEEALDLFNEMMCAGISPSCITIACALSACTSLEMLSKGRQVHALAKKMGISHEMLVGNAVIDFYSKCGDLDTARRVFDAMLNKDIYTWNTMIGAYCKAGYCGQAFMVFTQMQESDVRPNAVTWNTMIFGYLENKDDDQAVALFDRMGKSSNVKWDTASWNSLISGYSHMGGKYMSLIIFRQMQLMGFRPNAVTVLSVLPACANLVAFKKVKEIHGFVLRSNLDRSLSIVNLLIETYGKSGNMVYARTVFDGISTKDFISFHSLITGYVMHGCSSNALELFNQMKDLNLKPTGGTLAALILACGFSKMVDEGERILSSMSNDYQLTPALEHYAAMIHMYGRSAKIRDAVHLIDGMTVRPNSSVWSALLTASRVHGEIDLAILAAERLLELEPCNSVERKFLLLAYYMCSNPVYSFKVQAIANTVPELIGKSRMEVKNTVHTFVSGDLTASISNLCYQWIHKMEREGKEYAPHIRSCVDGEGEEDNGGIHSEKLAMAFAFISADSTPRSIRIMKTFRVCGDCHEMAKYVSKRYGCEIFLSDSKSFHHFKSGLCSCRDYW